MSSISFRSLTHRTHEAHPPALPTKGSNEVCYGGNGEAGNGEQAELLFRIGLNSGLFYISCVCYVNMITFVGSNRNTNTMSTIITKGNRAVVINEKNGSVVANLYVNVRQGISNADITMVRWSGKTLAAANRWAEKQLSA